MLEGAMLDDLNQFEILEHLAAAQNFMRNVYVVVGYNGHQIVGENFNCQAVSQGLADRLLNVVDQLLQDGRHQLAFAFAFVGAGRFLKEQAANYLHQARASVHGFIARQV